MIRKTSIAALAALSLTSTSAFAQAGPTLNAQLAAGAASSSSSSAASAASATGNGGNAAVVNNNPRQLYTGTAYAIAPPPTAMCQKTHAAGISVPFFGVSFSGSKGDKECYFFAMHDREEDGAMRCQLRYDHSPDERNAATALGYEATYCRNRIERPAPPPPPVIVAPAPPAPVIVHDTEVVYKTKVVYKARPVVHHRPAKHKPACGCKKT